MIQKVLVTARITHPYRGDLVVQVIAPDGQTAYRAGMIAPTRARARRGQCVMRVTIACMERGKRAVRTDRLLGFAHVGRVANAYIRAR